MPTYEDVKSAEPAAPGAGMKGKVWRWGHRALYFFLGGAFAGTLVLAWVAPSALVFVPVGIAGLVAGWYLFRHPLLNLGVVLFGFTVVLNPNPGLQIEEVLYAAYYLSYLAYWYGKHFLLERPSVTIRGVEDRTALILLVAGLALSLVLGIALSHPLHLMREEVQGFLMLAFFLPVKEACRRHNAAPYIVLAVIVWFATFVSIRNYLNYRAILSGATELWQIADSRAGFNELQLMTGSLGLLVLGLTVKHWTLRGLSLALFLLCFSGLILTKSRAFWVAFGLGVLFLFVFMNRAERKRLVGLVLFGATVSIVAAFLLLGDLALVLLEGITNRFLTLESATSKDVSLVNRFNEAAAVWEKIKANPFVGYGLGSPYKYYSWVYLFTSERAYVHIGYIGLWYKFGIGGLFGVLFFWARSWWCALSTSWNEKVPRSTTALSLFAAASLTSMTLTVITHNPFTYMDTMLIFAMLTGVAVGIAQRYPRNGHLVTTARRILNNLGALALARGVTAGLTLLILAYLGRVLGPDGFGILGVGAALVGYFAIPVNLGLNVYGVREVARDHERVGYLASHILSLRLLAFVVVYVAYLGVVSLFDKPLLFKTALAVQGTILFGYSISLEWVFQGLERMGTLAIRNVAAAVLAVCIAFALVHGPDDLIVAASATAAGVVLANLWLLVTYRRSFGPIRLQASVQTWKEILRPGFPIMTSLLMVSVYTNMDQLMLGILRTEEEVGWYTSAYRLLVAALIPADILFQAFHPALSDAKGDAKAMSQRGKAFSLTAFALGFPIALGGWGLADWLIVVVFGNPYAPAGGALGLLMLNAAVAYANVALGYPLLSWDRERSYAVALAVGGVCNIGLNFLLIPPLGITGAAIATISCQCVLLICLAYLHFRETGQLYITSILKTALATALGVGVPLTVGHVFGWWPPVIIVLSIALYSGASVALGVIDVHAARAQFRGGSTHAR